MKGSWILRAAPVLVGSGILALAACTSPYPMPLAVNPSPTPLTATTSPLTIPSPTQAPSAKKLVVETVASGLVVPWALAFAPDGRLFFTERPGRVRVIVEGKLLPEPVAVLPVAAVGEGGLLGIALRPDFLFNHSVYAYYTYRDPAGRLLNRVERFVEENNRLREPRVILEGIPGANFHDGGRIKFGPDGKLYITTGDAGQSTLSQDQASLAGKVLRLNPDGSVPEDNPFPGSLVYSYGHRNPQGLAWHPLTGELFATEHGPLGYDEVNILQPGKNYGWPLVTGRRGGTSYVDPVIDYSPSIAPSGATFYTGERYPEWKNSLLFTALVGVHLHRIVLKPPDYREVASEERLFQGELGRLRDVVQGPDGYLYITTSNRDGRGSPTSEDDRILRLKLQP